MGGKMRDQVGLCWDLCCHFNQSRSTFYFFIKIKTLIKAIVTFLYDEWRSTSPDLELWVPDSTQLVPVLKRFASIWLNEWNAQALDQETQNAVQ